MWVLWVPGCPRWATPAGSVDFGLLQHGGAGRSRGSSPLTGRAAARGSVARRAARPRCSAALPVVGGFGCHRLSSVASAVHTWMNARQARIAPETSIRPPHERRGFGGKRPEYGEDVHTAPNHHMSMAIGPPGLTSPGTFW